MVEQGPHGLLFMEITIRQYMDTDKSAIQNAIETLQDHEAAIDPLKLVVKKEGFGDRYMEYLAQRLKKDDGMIFVAESEGTVVGIVTAVILRYADHEVLGRGSEKLYGYVTDLYVDIDFRDQQVGKRLMDRAEEYFRSKGCDFATVGVLAPNMGTYDFYKKIGYADRYVDFIKKI